MNRTATPRDLIPESHCVLGTVLRPFSLGHHLLLARIGSPFEGDPSPAARPEDLSLAVFLCAAPFFQTFESLIRGDWPAEYAAWNRALKPRWWQPTRFVTEVELAKFTAYLKDGQRRAPVWRHGGTGLELSAPWECLLQCRLMSAGWSEREVLEGYLPKLWYAYHTLHEIRQMDDFNPRFSRWQKVFWTETDEARWQAIPRN